MNVVELQTTSSVTPERQVTVPGARRAGPPRSFDEFERRLPSIAGQAPLGAVGWTGQRAATLAREIDDAITVYDPVPAGMMRCCGM